MELRWYQSEAVEAVWNHIRHKTGNPVVELPTGAGKSLALAEMTRQAVNQWNGRVLILQHVKELIEQNAAKLQALCPTIRVGLYSAGLGRRETATPVVVAGIQSVFNRADQLGRFDLVLIDEAHLVPESGDGMYRQLIRAIQEVNPDVVVVGLTATPYRTGDGDLCTPDGVLNAICYRASVKTLVAQGFLSKLIGRRAWGEVDTHGLHTRAGDFVDAEVEGRMMGEGVVEQAAGEIVAQCVDRRSVLVFCQTVAHAEAVRDAIFHSVTQSVLTARRQLAPATQTGDGSGFPLDPIAPEQSAETCIAADWLDDGGHPTDAIRRFLDHGNEVVRLVTGQTPSDERADTLAAFKAGRVKYLVNVNVLTTGFDAPNVDCVAVLRATLSPGLFYQMCLDMETEVLTDRGWLRCHDVAAGDVVASFDTATEEVVFAACEAKTHRTLRRNESMYGLSAPHLDVRVTNNHNMVVRGKGKTCLDWQIQPAEEAADRKSCYQVPVAGLGRVHDVDATISDDDVRFLGWFLTDGSLNESNNSVVISQSKSKHADEIRTLIDRCGFAFSESMIDRSEEGYADIINFNLTLGSPKGERVGRRSCCDLSPWLSKDIPAVYDSLSSRQFALLIDSMNKGNGSNRKTPDYTPRVMDITTGCRRRMADRIQALAVQRGYRCNVARWTPNPSAWNANPQEQWRVRLKTQVRATVGGINESSAPNAGERCRMQPVAFLPNEWVWCLTTAYGTLVTRRNGKVAVVGNCGRGFRICEGKTNCLVLDFGGNIERHGPVDDIRPRPKGEAKECEPITKTCPECRAVVAPAVRECPGCRYVWPVEVREPNHAGTASGEPLSGTDTDETKAVTGVEYRLHTKKGATDDAPKTLRVTYKCGFMEYVSEWICVEHPEGGFAHRKAAAWWAKRCHLPMPDSVVAAVAYGQFGLLAVPTEIVVRTKGKDAFPEIVKHTLGAIPSGPTPCDGCEDVANIVVSPSSFGFPAATCGLCGAARGTTTGAVYERFARHDPDLPDNCKRITFAGDQSAHEDTKAFDLLTTIADDDCPF